MQRPEKCFAFTFKDVEFDREAAGEGQLADVEACEAVECLRRPVAVFRSQELVEHDISLNGIP